MSEASPTKQKLDEFRASLPPGDEHTEPTREMLRVTSYACNGAPDKQQALADAEKAKPEKVRVEKHKIKADVKKEKVTETRVFPLMFDITEKAQKHRDKRLAKEAEKAAKEAEKEAEKAAKEANEKKGKTTP